MVCFYFCISYAIYGDISLYMEKRAQFKHHSIWKGQLGKRLRDRLNDLFLVLNLSVLMALSGLQQLQYIQNIIHKWFTWPSTLAWLDRTTAEVLEVEMSTHNYHILYYEVFEDWEGMYCNVISWLIMLTKRLDYQAPGHRPITNCDHCDHCPSNHRGFIQRWTLNWGRYLSDRASL